jgi:hypothetical protein
VLAAAAAEPAAFAAAAVAPLQSPAALHVDAGVAAAHLQHLGLLRLLLLLQLLLLILLQSAADVLQHCAQPLRIVYYYRFR